MDPANCYYCYYYYSAATFLLSRLDVCSSVCLSVCLSVLLSCCLRTGSRNVLLSLRRVWGRMEWKGDERMRMRSGNENGHGNGMELGS
jgi:hypothetical protein